MSWVCNLKRIKRSVWMILLLKWKSSDLAVCTIEFKEHSPRKTTSTIWRLSCVSRMWNIATSMTILLEWTSDFHELLIYFIALYRPECTITQQHIKSENFYLIIIAISEQNSVLHYHEHNVNALLESIYIGLSLDQSCTFFSSHFCFYPRFQSKNIESCNSRKLYET